MKNFFRANYLKGFLRYQKVVINKSCRLIEACAKLITINRFSRVPHRLRDSVLRADLTRLKLIIKRRPRQILTRNAIRIQQIKHYNMVEQNFI